MNIRRLPVRLRAAPAAAARFPHDKRSAPPSAPPVVTYPLFPPAVTLLGCQPPRFPRRFHRMVVVVVVKVEVVVFGNPTSMQPPPVFKVTGASHA